MAITIKIDKAIRVNIEEINISHPLLTYSRVIGNVQNRTNNGVKEITKPNRIKISISLKGNIMNIAK